MPSGDHTVPCADAGQRCVGPVDLRRAAARTDAVRFRDDRVRSCRRRGRDTRSDWPSGDHCGSPDDSFSAPKRTLLPSASVITQSWPCGRPARRCCRRRRRRGAVGRELNRRDRSQLQQIAALQTILRVGRVRDAERERRRDEQSRESVNRRFMGRYSIVMRPGLMPILAAAFLVMTPPDNSPPAFELVQPELFFGAGRPGERAWADYDGDGDLDEFIGFRGRAESALPAGSRRVRRCRRRGGIADTIETRRRRLG